MRKRLVVVGLLALVSALATSSLASAAVPEKSKPLTAKQFRKAANRICAETGELLERAADQVDPDRTENSPLTPEQLQEFADLVEPIIEERIDGIAALKPPTSLKAKVKGLLRTAREDLEGFLDDPTIALEADPFADTNLQAEKLGLTDCL